MALRSTGAASNGVPVVFSEEVYPFSRVWVQFLTAYFRDCGVGAFAPNVPGPVSPNLTPINKQAHFQIGDVAQIGINEAQALAAAGVVALV